MTFLEHASFEHGLNPSLPCAVGGRGGEDKDENKVANVAMAMTMADAGKEGQQEREQEEAGNIVGDETRNNNGSEDERHVAKGGNAIANVVGVDSESVGSCGRLSDTSPSLSAVPLRSSSNSASQSGSQSQSKSSIKEALELGGSSAATSWTQAERPSGDSERRPSADKVRAELTQAEEVNVEIAEERRAPREGTEVAALPRARGDEGGDVMRKEVILVQEEDIGEGWHPLHYSDKARFQGGQDGEGEKRGRREEDVGSIRALETTHDGDSSFDINEKDRWRTIGSSGRNSRNLRLEFKSPSPQLWDEVERATDNNEAYMSDYYSTLNSKKFGTLQKSSRRRPLIPHSTYYSGPPPSGSAYGTPPVGQIGIHHPREIVRIERDYAGGEIIQFSPIFPLELEGRVTPTQFLQTINEINEILISAHSVWRAFIDNVVSVISLQLSTLVLTSHYTKAMRRLERKIGELNTQLYNPVGLHIVWPEKVAFLFLEIEYY